MTVYKMHTPFTCAIYFSREMTGRASLERANADIAEITQPRTLNSARDRERSFLVNGPSVARGRFIAIARTRFASIVNGRSKTSYRRKWVDILLRQAQISNFAVYLSRLLVGCGLFVISLPFPICPRTTCDNSSLLLLPHISGQRFTSWNSRLSMPQIEFSRSKLWSISM